MVIRRRLPLSKSLEVKSLTMSVSAARESQGRDPEVTAHQCLPETEKRSF